MRLITALLASLLCLMLCTTRPHAAEPDPSVLCQRATAAAEHESGVPDELLDAISRVETGRYDTAQGALRAWPWTINEEGHGHFYNSKNEAVAAAREFRARGIQSMDVGCTQINLMYHPNAFASLEAAFDPGQNARYAAHFLMDLFHQVGSWPHAAAAYHSQTPELGTDYQRKVLQAWAEPINQPGLTASASGGRHASPGDIHREFASLGSSGAMPGEPASEVPRRPTLLSAPAARPPIARPMGSGGLGSILRAGSHQFAFTRRGLAAYRAMPVAMLSPRAPLTRY